MALQATGLGSGLDINALVEQLVTAERQPASNRLNLQEARTNAELSALGKLKSALSSFQDSLKGLGELENFQQRITTVSDDTLIGASADSNAVPGRYDVEVLSLAQRQKLASGPFASADSAVGDGQLGISILGVTSSITIAPEANTLTDIRDAINTATDNPGVLATIVNADDGARLLISSRETGADQTITISTAGGDGGLAALVYDPLSGTNPMTQLEKAADASALIDGFAVSSDSNQVINAIEGVSIDLLEAVPGTPIEVTVDFDEPAGNAAVGAFVNAYNALLDTVAEVTKFDAETGEAAALLGDSVVRGIKDNLRREIGNAVDLPGATFRTLAEIGITSQPNGRLELDDTKLAGLITDDFDAVGLLFAGEQGVATRLGSRLEEILNSTSTINLRETRLKDDLETIGDRRTRLDERMEGVRERLLRQFNAMDRLLGSLNNTSQFLSQQLGV